jgi:hypothetical protein
MMTLRELQKQLMTDYGITAKWLDIGFGHWVLEVHLSDVSDEGYGVYMYIGSEEFNFINELDTPVSTVSGEISRDGIEDGLFFNVPIGDMARKVAADMLALSGMLNP